MVLFLSSCVDEGYDFEQRELPENPVNLEDFNSEYDDYNSTAPSLGRLIPFCFSTNRNSNGSDFDVIFQPMNVNFNKTSGLLKVTNEYANWGIYKEKFDAVKNGLSKINTSGNEFGPYLVHTYNSGSTGAEFLLLYASDVSGNFDINYSFKKDSADFSDSKPVEFLNTGSDDLYPSFNSDFSKLYFCSDREDGHFNVFYTDIISDDDDIITELSDTTYHEIVKDTIISSDYDDKCPYIFGDILVFSSNRSGGFGGYDLYYSTFEDGQWNAPVNFGSEINTADDEYRPILFNEGVDNERHMMVFSSDRTGGKGGFDLYFAGVKHNN